MKSSASEKSREIYGGTKTLEKSTLDTVAAHDTFQKLSYKSRVPFDALWESFDTYGIGLTPLIRRKYLGDEGLKNAIKSRPRVYMTPYICLDDISDSDVRKTIINFTYATTTRKVNEEVWGTFKPRSPCLAFERLEKCATKSTPKIACNLKRDESNKENEIRKLISQQKLNRIYDKFPLSYGGFRPRFALGVPLEETNLDNTHPNVSVSKAIYKDHSLTK